MSNKELLELLYGHGIIYFDKESGEVTDMDDSKDHLWLTFDDNGNIKSICFTK